MTQLILLQNCPNQPLAKYQKHQPHICVSISCSEVIDEIGFNFSFLIIRVDISSIKNVNTVGDFILSIVYNTIYYSYVLVVSPLQQDQCACVF